MSSVKLTVTLNRSCRSVIIGILREQSKRYVLVDSVEYPGMDRSTVNYNRNFGLSDLNDSKYKLIVVDAITGNLLAEDRIVKGSERGVWTTGATITGCAGRSTAESRGLQRYYVDNGTLIPQDLEVTDTNPLWFYLSIFMILLAIGLVIWYYLRNRKEGEEQPGAAAFR